MGGNGGSSGASTAGSGHGGAATGGTRTGGSPGSGGGVQGSGGTVVGIEAGTAGGSSTEAGVAEAGGPLRWCDHQPTALFCEDFDRFSDVDKFLGSWTTYSIAGGQFTFDTSSNVPSAPNALRVTTTATADVKTLIAQNLPAFAQLPNRLRMEFTLRINKAANIGYLSGAAFAGFFNGPEVTDGAVAIAIGTALVGGANQLEVAYVEPTRDSGPGFNAKASQNPFPGMNQWIGRYALDIQYGASSTGRVGCARLLAGGIDQLGGCLNLPATLGSPKTVTVVLGIYTTGLGNNSGDIELEFDNLVVTSQ